MRCEGREGMGSDFSYAWDHLSEPELVAQQVLQEQGRPFTRLWQEGRLLDVEGRNAFGIKVRVQARGSITEGWGEDEDVVVAAAKAYHLALAPLFPKLREFGSPTVRTIDRNGHSSTDLVFATATHTLVSRREGVVNSQGKVTLVAEGLMAAVHLTNGVK